MKYKNFISAVSEARLSKYKYATKGKKKQLIQLYHHNIKLSQRMFGVIGMFEIILRNAIYRHYTKQYNNSEWIITEARYGKLLEHEANSINKTKTKFIRLGTYSADKMVATFSFGFWTYLFSRRNYRLGGKTLLQIFPYRKKGVKAIEIYNELNSIREFRNRVAHHEPICFDIEKNINSTYAWKIYKLICTYLEYMGYDATKALKIVEKPDSVLRALEKMNTNMNKNSGEVSN